MRRVRMIGCVVAGLLAGTGPAGITRGEETGDLERSARLATVLAVSPTGGGGAPRGGTAFCIDPAGYFITSTQVAKFAGTKLSIVVNPGGGGGEEGGGGGGGGGKQILPAVVLRTDPAGLALLKVDGRFVALPRGTVADLAEKQALRVAGFTALPQSLVDQPKLSPVVTQPVALAGLKKKLGVLELLQLDRKLPMGFAGGPVLDAGGKVVGVATIAGGAEEGGGKVEAAIPVSVVEAFLARPVLTLAPLEVALGEQNKIIQFTVKVTALSNRPLSVESVELELGQGKELRKLALQAAAGEAGAAGEFVGKIQPKSASATPLQLPCAAVLPDGPLACTMADQTLTLGGRIFKLSEVQSLVRNDKTFTLAAWDGTVLEGPSVQPTTLRAETDLRNITLDLLKIRSLTFPPPARQADTVPFRVMARSAGKEVGRADGEIKLIRPPASAPAPNK